MTRAPVIVGAVLSVLLAPAAVAGKKGNASITLLQGGAQGVTSSATSYSLPPPLQASVDGPSSSGGLESVVVGFSPHSCVPIWPGLPDRGGFPIDYTFSDTAGGGDCMPFAAPLPFKDNGAPGDPEVPLEELVEAAVDEAIALAVTPELVIAPNRRGITGLRSYFWLRSTPPPVSATASVPGFSVSAEAYPVRYVWNFGEGGERTTTDAGRAWSRKRPGSIAHFYETKGSYEVSVQVIYEARWRAGNGAWNALGYFSNLDSRLYRVREVRAYLTDSDD